MAIIWKVDPVELLKSAGYSSYRIRQEKIFGQQTYRNLRERRPVGFDALNTICKLTKKKPGQLLDYVPDGKLPPKEQETTPAP